MYIGLPIASPVLSQGIIVVLGIVGILAMPKSKIFTDSSAFSLRKIMMLAGFTSR